MRSRASGFQPLGALLRLLGKQGPHTLAVFAEGDAVARRAIEHLRQAAPNLPVYLFTASEPSPETAALCEFVLVRRNSVALFLSAQRRLWPTRVALSAGAWTGFHGNWPAKLAPLVTPPFRAVLVNEHGDFFSGTPTAISQHAAWRTRTSIARLYHRVLSGLDAVRDATRDAARTCGSFAAANGLLALGTLLRIVGYPHRRWFPKLHGAETLNVALAPPPGDGVTIFTQPGNTWDAAALERCARSSGARWILWHPSGVQPAPASSLSPLFSRAGVFAAATQAHFRGWKPSLFPMSPFRSLQPGEAAQTLAPIPETILVDRAMLLLLGIPRCRFASTAWMLVFWKAAAAGWRSYSVGREAPSTQEPDHPLSEAGFLLRLLTSKALRRLAPLEPELSRGNIAFSPALAWTAAPARKPRVLIVSPFLPYPLSHGGAVRIYNLCRALSSHVDFMLAAVREKDELVDYARLGEVFREVYAVDLDEAPPPRPQDPGPVNHYRSRSLDALIARICRDARPDLLQIEYTQMAAYRDCAPHIPAILVEHDVTFSLYRQLAESEKTPAAEAEYQRWLRFERRWLARYNAVWTVSGDDRQLVLDESDRDPASTWVIANGVDIDRYRPSQPSPSDASCEPEVLFVGSFRHLPNAIAFDKLAHEVMPRVWETVPTARLRVVAGPRYQEFWQRFTQTVPRPPLDPRIVLTGFTEDLRPLYRSAAVVTAPLAVSAGTNIKVLEAMACGKAIVGTSAGCQGLGLRNAKEALISNDWVRFADAVAWLLRDPALRRRLGAAARRAAEARFSWNSIAAEAWDSYRALADASRDAPSEVEAAARQ